MTAVTRTTSPTRIAKCLVAGESPSRPQLAPSHGPQAHRVSLPSCEGCGPISIALDKENEEVRHENEPRLKSWLVFAFLILPAPPFTTDMSLQQMQTPTLRGSRAVWLCTGFMCFQLSNVLIHEPKELVPPWVQYI